MVKPLPTEADKAKTKLHRFAEIRLFQMFTLLIYFALCTVSSCFQRFSLSVCTRFQRETHGKLIDFCQHLSLRKHYIIKQHLPNKILVGLTRKREVNAEVHSCMRISIRSALTKQNIAASPFQLAWMGPLQLNQKTYIVRIS